MLNQRVIHAVELIALVAARPANETITTAELASQMHVSMSSLEGVIKSLREAGFIKSLRGQHGGYLLTDRSNEATVWDVASLFLSPADEDESLPKAGMSAIDGLEQAYRRETIQALKQFRIQQFKSSSSAPTKHSLSPKMPAFRVKPLRPRLLPQVPNSIFAVSSFMHLQAA
jgi:Rrf2 family protein